MKYKVVETSMFKKELKIIKKRRKSIQKLKEVINTLLKGEKLEIKLRFFYIKAIFGILQL